MSEDKLKNERVETAKKRKGVFMIREKGMSFKEYQKAFIDALDKAGLLSPDEPEEKQEQEKVQEQGPKEDWFDRMIKHPPVATPQELAVLEFGPPKKKKSGDGSSAEQAVVINATSTLIGVPEEYAYIGRVCGIIDIDFTVGMQMQIDHQGRHYDLIYVRMLKDDSKREFWFDVTSFFGKL